MSRERFITSGPAARLLGVSKLTLFRLVRAGKLNVVKIAGGRWGRFDRVQVEDLVKTQNPPR